MRKKLINKLLLFVAFFTFTQVAQAQIKMPQPSPASKLTQTVGLTEVTVEYSRPAKRDREIFGGLVPYGEVWRTGANASTKITFSSDVTIKGMEMPAGTYALYTIPGKDEWTIILNKNTKLWGSSGYAEVDDALRFVVKTEELERTIESFTINVTDITNNSANIELAWDNTAVKFGFETEVDAIVMAEIKQKVMNIDRTNANLFYQAASYYYNNDKDMEQALAWVQKAVDARPEAYWVQHLHAKILAKKEDFKQAIKAAEKSKEAAQKANNPDYVRLNEQKIEEWKKM